MTPFLTTQTSPNSSIVVWIPVYDCLRENGCLEILSNSHKIGVAAHEGFYLDELNKRHFRYQLPDSLQDEYSIFRGEAQSGDALINHFNTIHRSGHRSGDNISNKVRYTLTYSYFKYFLSRLRCLIKLCSPRLFEKTDGYIGPVIFFSLPLS